MYFSTLPYGLECQYVWINNIEKEKKKNVDETFNNIPVWMGYLPERRALLVGEQIGCT